MDGEEQFYLHHNLLTELVGHSVHVYSSLKASNIIWERFRHNNNLYVLNIESHPRGTRKDGWWKTKLRKMLQPATRYGLPGVYFTFIIIFFFIGIISDGTVNVQY